MALELIEGFKSAQGGDGGFNAILAPNRTDFMLRVRSRTVLEVQLPPTPLYDIVQPETITLTVPPAALLSRGAVVATPDWVVLPSQGVPSLRTSADGELMTEIREEALQSNGTDIFVQLDSDGFNPLIGLDTVESVRLIDAFVSDKAEATGWNAIVRTQLTYTALSLVETERGAAVKVSVPAFPLYNILAPETLRITLPATLPLSGQAVTIEQGIRIAATPGSADVMGTLTALTNNIGTDPADRRLSCCSWEENLQASYAERAFAPTLILKLYDDAWEPGIELGGTAFRALVAALASDGVEGGGWNAIVQQAIRPRYLEISGDPTTGDGHTLTLTLPPIPEYTVDSPELVTINLPAAAVVSRNTIPAYPTLQLRATPGVPTLNGSLYDNAIEAYLQDGPSELLVTVAGDKWIKALGEKTAEGTAAARMFLEGLSSPTNGSSWMGVLRPTLLGEFDKKTNVTEGEELTTGYDWLTRVSNDTLAIAIPRLPNYDVLLPEQIDLRIGNSLVMSNWTLLLPEALIIVPTPGSATMSGSALYNLSEAELAFNRTVLDLSLIISLRADSWLKAVEQDPTVAAQLFAGIKSDQHEKYGWNNVVQQGLHKGLVERLDDVTLSLSIPMFEDYSITAPEVLRVNLPAVALKSNQTIAATPSIRIPATPGTAQLYGPFVNGPNGYCNASSCEFAPSTELRVRYRPDLTEFNISLRNDSFIDGVGERDLNWQKVLSRRLLAGIAPSGRWGAEPDGWKSVVQPALLAADPPPLLRIDAMTLAVAVPAAALYDVIAPESLTLYIDGTLLKTEAQIIAEPKVVVRPTPGVAALSGSLLCAEGTFATYESPPPPPPPAPNCPSEDFCAILPPPAPSTPPASPPAAPGWPPPPNCNNTEKALSDPHQEHELVVTLTNDSYIPILLDKTHTASGSDGIHPGVNYDLDGLIQSIEATSWLHWGHNISEQAGEPLLAGGWNAIVQPALRSAKNDGSGTASATFDVHTNETTLVIRWRGIPQYAIWAPETLSVNLPGRATRSDAKIAVAPSVVLWAEAGTGVLEGTFVETPKETSIALAEQLLVIKLVDDMWAPAVGRIACSECPYPASMGGKPAAAMAAMEGNAWSPPPSPPPPRNKPLPPDLGPTGCPCHRDDPSAYYDDFNSSMAVINSIATRFPLHGGDELQKQGWNNIVREALLAGDRFTPRLWRVDDFTLNLTLPQMLSYDIDTPETVVPVIPATVTTSEAAVTSSR